MRAAGVAVALVLVSLGAATGAQASGGSILGWGANGQGEVGSGAPSATPVPTPVAVSGISTATAISSNYYNGMALLADGTVRIWGYNETGQLTTGGTTDSAVPVPVAGLSGVVGIATSYQGGIAVLADGTVRTWGYNGDGDLGIGSSDGPETCLYSTDCSKHPVPVPGLTNVVAVAAGQHFYLALLADGTVMGWGEDSRGALGDGVGVQSGCDCVDHPVRIPGVSGAVAIAAGERFGMALLADGSVRSWGNNSVGELGNGTTTPDPPECRCLAAVRPLVLPLAKAIAAGEEHALSIPASGGLEVWGDNYHGELGLGAKSTGTCSCIPNPTLVPGFAPRAVSGGGSYSLAVLEDGTVWSWGYDQNSQLGDGGTADRPAPAPVKGVSGASAVSGFGATSFALIGPSQSLSVTLAGAGAGSVGTNGLLCPGACSAKFPQGQVEILRAEPAPGSGFAGFSGPCTGTAPCQVRMNADQMVTATFGPPTGTAITAARINRKKRTASFSFTAPGAITGFECELIKPKLKHHKKHHGKAKAGKAKKKAPKPSFSACVAGQTYKHLLPGFYSFAVRALDSLGADAVPATLKFHLPKPKLKHHHRKHKPAKH